MDKQISLWIFTPEIFDDQQREILLSNPQSGASMAVDALIPLIRSVNKHWSLSSDLAKLLEKFPDPKTDMLYWLNFIQNHPGLGMSVLSEQDTLLYRKAEFLLTVTHLVANGAADKARFMF